MSSAGKDGWKRLKKRTEEAMKQAMTAEEKYKMMMDTPINRLIPRLAVPTIISMLITSI